MTTDLAQSWSSALGTLQGQMTKSTFDSLLTGSRLLARENGRCQVAVSSQQAAQWLAGRWQVQVERAISQALGVPSLVQFVVPAPAESPPAMPLPAPSTPLEPRPLPKPHPNTDQAFAQLDYRYLWKHSGFVMASDYAAKFWQPLLGGRAYALWLYIQAENKEAGLWTRPRRFSVRKLSRTLRIGPTSITGGLRPCHFAEKQKLLGKSLSCCCARYTPAAWDYETRTGDKQCMHWNPGALEELYQAHLLGIRIEADSAHPRAQKMHLQVWSLLPLLTPGQLAQLSEVDQLHHERWIDQYGHLVNVDLAGWEELSTPSLIPLMEGYPNHELTDIYQPNPLLEVDNATT